MPFLPFSVRTTQLIYGIEFWSRLLMGGELGNETYIDVLLESSVFFQPNFTLIGNDDFFTTFVWKSWCF